MTTTTAFIGLGAMGTPMATRLAGILDDLAVHDLSEQRMAALTAHGARAGASPADAARDAEVIVLMVVDADQARSALFGPDGAAAAAADGAVVVLMSTVGPEPVRMLGRELDAAGLRLVDAPVSGGVARAQAGDLLVMVGAAAADLAAVAEHLDAMASSVVHCGEAVGDGQSVKLVNQLLCGVHIAVAGEALAYASALGLDPAVVHETIRHGAAGSFMFDDRGSRMVERAFEEPKSALNIFVKDLGLVLEAAGSQRFPTPLTTAANQLFLMGAAQGMGYEDDSGILRVYERWLAAPDDTPAS